MLLIIVLWCILNRIVCETTPIQTNHHKVFETPRRFLQTYNSRNPVIVLIDNTLESHVDAFNFMKNLYGADNRARAIDFLLMRFNETDVSEILSIRKNSVETLQKIFMDFTIESSSLGHDVTNRSAGFYAILNAAARLPANSGIIVFINRATSDEDLAHLAVNNLRNRGIKLYVIWGGYEPVTKQEEKLLREVAATTGGQFLINTNIDLSKKYFYTFMKDKNVQAISSVVLRKRNLERENLFYFPINSDVNGMLIQISPKISIGVLVTPRGYKIDVFSGESVSGYSEGSFSSFNTNTETTDVFLNTTSVTMADAGLWSLYVVDIDAVFNITVYVHTKLETNAAIVEVDASGFKEGNKKSRIKFELSGGIKEIRNISFANQNGAIVLSNVNFTLGNMGDKYELQNTDVETISSNKEIQIDVENLPKGPLYAIAAGVDEKGYNFERVAYVSSYTANPVYVLAPLTVDISLGSELLLPGNRKSQIYFEVTNNLNKVAMVRFAAKDDRSILYSLDKYFEHISPQETTTVRLTLVPNPGPYVDHIFFTAVGSETVTKEVIVDVDSKSINEQDNPELSYSYTSDCTDVLLGKCKDGTWTISVYAKDSGSGLLHIDSIPKGLYFPNGFTAGTREEVTGYYSDSCCNPTIQLIALDRLGNRSSREANAYHAKLSPGSIAAIVLGVLIILVIIILLIFLCCKKCKCRKDSGSFELPTYGSRRY